MSAHVWMWWPVKGHPRSHQFWRLTIGAIFFGLHRIFPEVATILVHVYSNICHCELALRSVKHKLHDDDDDDDDDDVFGLVYFFCGAWALLRHSLPCLRFLDQTQSDTHMHLVRPFEGMISFLQWPLSTQHKRKVSMPIVGVEATITAVKWLQTYPSDCTATRVTRLLQ